MKNRELIEELRAEIERLQVRIAALEARPYPMPCIHTPATTPWPGNTWITYTSHNN